MGSLHLPDEQASEPNYAPCERFGIGAPLDVVTMQVADGLDKTHTKETPSVLLARLAAERQVSKDLVD